MKEELSVKTITPLESALRDFIISQDSKWSFATNHAFSEGWKAAIKYSREKKGDETQSDQAE